MSHHHATIMAQRISANRKMLLGIYGDLLKRYGPQHWWPAETPFEVMVGAILTQATSWVGAAKAIARLKAADALSPTAIRGMDTDALAELIHTSVYHNSKARRLKELAAYLGSRFGDDIDGMARQEADTLREELLSVYGIGDETADTILLYAVGKPAFVIDAYTMRLFSRLGLIPERRSYSAHREMFTTALPADQPLFAEYHALIVRHAVEVCRRRPECGRCCLLRMCPTGKEVVER